MKFFFPLFLFSFTVFSLDVLAKSDEEPSFILVHGALFTEGGWSKTKNLLEKSGYPVFTLNVPGRAGDGIDPKSLNLQKAAESVCRVVNSLRGPLVLVGHSQGGALITQAFSDCGKDVIALVYVAAVLPLNGEIAFQMLDPKRDIGFGQCTTVDPNAGLFRLNPKSSIADRFFQDAPEAEKKALLASMVDEPISIGTTPAAIDMDRLKMVSKFYIEAEEDRILTLPTQRNIQKRVLLNRVYSMKTGHCPFLSSPKEFVEILTEIAKSSKHD